MDPSRIYLAVHTLEFRISSGPTLIYFSEFFHAYTPINFCSLRLSLILFPEIFNF